MTDPGVSQNSASSGIILITRIFGSSALSHHAFAGVENNRLILARSLETTGPLLLHGFGTITARLQRCSCQGRPWNSCRLVADGLDVVAVGIEHEGAVVIAVIMRAD